MTAKNTVMGLGEGSLVQDRYEIKDLLGRGGFGAVFRAYDSHIEREVAIKVLNVQALVSQGNDLATMLARFEREAKLAARIKHPCVVDIYDYGVLENQENPFIVMEHLEGRELEEEISIQGPLDPVAYLPLFVECLEALGDAHKLGIVHKDLKPSNLFVTDGGTRRARMRLLDFGIAHLGDGDGSDSRLTQTGFLLGTPKYLAPEYVEHQLVSPQFDVYQMGLILVEALAGKPVIEGDNLWQISVAHVAGELYLPVELLRSPLGPVLVKALAREREERFADAGAFADALAQVDPEQVPKLSLGAERQLLGQTVEVELPGEEVRALIEEAGAVRARITAEAELRRDAWFEKTPTLRQPELAPTTAQVEAAAGLSRKKFEAQHILGVLVLLVLLAMGTLLLLTRQSEDEESELSALAATTSAEVPDAEFEEAPQLQALPEVLEEEEVIEEEPLVETITVRTLPATARVRVEGELRGQGEVEVEFDAEEEALEIEVILEGYDSFRRQVSRDDGPVVTVELTRSAPERAPVVRQAPTRPTQPRRERTEEAKAEPQEVAEPVRQDVLVAP